jgi:4-methyl-5(b-hydroxyethyl)-thiazole monophosphate biosynthesis
MPNAPRVLVILAEGYESIEAVTPVNVLRRAGAEVTVAGVGDGPVLCSRGVKILPDAPLASVADDPFDLVVLPGGMPGATNLRDEPLVKQVIERALESDGAVGAICAAPAVVLSTHGFLTGKAATCHPSLAEQMVDGKRIDDRVVVDGNVITSKGAGTAMEFAFSLVHYLFGAKKVVEVNEGMFARI